MVSENPIVKAFYESTRDALSTMAMLEIEFEEISEIESMAESLGFSVVVGLAGGSQGLLVISVTDELCRTIVSSMLGLSPDELEGESDLLDGVGELGNMVAGQAKTHLAGTPHAFVLSLPTAVAGAKIELRPKPMNPGILISCRIGAEPIRIGLWMDGVLE